MAKYLNSDGLAYFLGKLKPLINAKADKTHTHNYAGSSSTGGSANSAVKLDTSTAGSATQPVYFTNGKPSACTYTLGCSVPAGAKFTDSWRPVQNVLTSTSISDSLSAYQGKVLNETKAAKDHTHNYAGSDSAGGAANNSLKLNGASLSSGSTVNSRVAYISANGVLETGRYIDLHWVSGEDKDYTHRISLADGIGAIKFEPKDNCNVSAVFSTTNPTSGIGFSTNKGMMGYIAFNEVNGNLKRINNRFNKEYKIYDASNITYGTGNPPATASNGDIYIQYS